MAHRFQIPPSAKLVDPTSWSLVLDGYGLLGIRILGEVDDTPHMLDERELYFNLRKEITSMGVARVLKFEKETSTLNSIALAQSWSDDLAKKLSLELGSNLGLLGLDFSGVVESSWNRLERFEVVVNELTTVTEKFEEEVTIAESQNDHLLLFDQYRRVRADVRFRSIASLSHARRPCRQCFDNRASLARLRARIRVVRPTPSTAAVAATFNPAADSSAARRMSTTNDW